MSLKSWWLGRSRADKKKTPREAAEDLLKSVLTDKERLEVWKNWELTVPTPRGNFTVKGFMNPEDERPIFNVQHENGTKYCLHLRETLEGYPRYDHLVAQILLLKTDPDRFLREANSDNHPIIRMRDEFACSREREAFPGILEMLQRINQATEGEWTLRIPARIDDFDMYQRFILDDRTADRHYVVAISNYEIREAGDAQLIRFLESKFMEAINTNLVGRRDMDIQISQDGAWRW